MAAATTNCCNFSTRFTPLPSAALCEIMDKTASKLPLVTPVSPIRAKSAAVKVLLGVTPAASCMMASTISAISSSSEKVFI